MSSPTSGPEARPTLPRVVVSDAGPLIALGRLDLLFLLPAQFADVQVPQQVLNECTARPDSADVARILHAFANGWLTPCEATPIVEQSLGQGERAAIARALEIGAGLLADDLDARLYAQARGLPTVGTLGVLVRGKRDGMVPSIRPLIQQLRASGQRLGAGVVEQALAAAGEADT